MNSRYTRVFTLTNNLYQKNSPVIVSAGALLKDNKENKVVAQLKIKNVSSDIIKTTKVIVHTFDVAGNPMDSDSTHEYLDLNVPQYGEFGQQVAVAIENNVTRSFSVEVVSVVFANNCVWQSNSEIWSPIPKQSPLSSIIPDENFAVQYINKNCEKCRNAPLEYEDLWICSCGAINRKDEQSCCECNCSKNNIFNINVDELRRMGEKQRKIDRFRQLGKYSPNSGERAKPIEWIILAEENGNILILSKYIIECRKFNERKTTDQSWGKSSIRRWLNGYFFERAFSDEEKSNIIETEIDGEKDRVFLLSKKETEKYFNNASERICKSTMFPLGTLAQNYYNRKNSWMLRTSTTTSSKMWAINNDVVMGDTGQMSFASICNLGIRPAMWVKVD